MSLINDALKQTKQSQPQNPPAHPPPLTPAGAEAGGRGVWLIAAVIILLFAAAGIFIGLSLSRHLSQATDVTLHAATRNQPAEIARIVRTVVTNTAPASNTVTAAAPKPWEPKLQGIMFAAPRPCAIVNGKTVFVGDQINGFHVMAISKDSVTLQSQTETKVLSLSPR